MRVISWRIWERPSSPSTSGFLSPKWGEEIVKCVLGTSWKNSSKTYSSEWLMYHKFATVRPRTPAESPGPWPAAAQTRAWRNRTLRPPPRGGRRTGAHTRSPEDSAGVTPWRGDLRVAGRDFSEKPAPFWFSLSSLRSWAGTSHPHVSGPPLRLHRGNRQISRLDPTHVFLKSALSVIQAWSRPLK